ncbi:MAG: hypothetical protein C0594_17430 [Marinilabiliales bacterium]|nr:MAG: hypothetical protein C0594_17430 [Marinilabiliales bacterium]
MKNFISLLALLLLAFAIHAQQEVKIEKFTLDNGLTVILSEDHTMPEVFGCVMTRAGSKDDPDDATGMAHYMEHMLFKGTSDLGTVDWTKEKPHIDRIFHLYDELCATDIDSSRQRIQKQINEESIKAGEYAIPNELSNLINEMGGTNMNAGTGPDYTIFYNAFPPNQMERWLELYSHRFMDPVFRGFQAELEVIYEEKNMYSDMFIFSLIQKFGQQFFKNHPYGQKDRIGTVDDLKNPNLTKMYKFFKTWYVANNMGLVIVGDFNSEEIKPLIKEKFGRLPKGNLPKRKVYEEKPFNGREFYEGKFSPIKMGLLGFRTVPEGHPDALPLTVCNQLLANQNQTGLLDKLSMDGKILAAQVMSMPYNDHGATIMLVIPKLVGQKLEDAEQLVLNEVHKLHEGDFDESMVTAIKQQLYVDHERSLESNESKAVQLATLFAQGRSVEEINNYTDEVNSITKDDIIRVAKNYYGKNYLAFFSKMGFSKNEKVDKPDYEPVIANTNARSPFAKEFEKITSDVAKIDYIDFDKAVQTKEIAKGAVLKKVENPVNDIFELTLRYGVGNFKMPLLEYASTIMNYSGVEDMEVSDFKKEFGKLGCSYSISSSDSYLYVEVTGLDKNLDKAIALINKLMTNPKLDPEKLDIIVEAVKSERKMERSEPDNIADALFEYVRYGDKSSYLNRLSMKEISKLNTDTLVSKFKKGLEYEADFYYTGTKPLGDVTNMIKQDLYITANPIKSDSPVFRDAKEYKDNTVYLVNKKKAVQSKIFLYTKLGKYNNNEKPVIEAFNLYFGGGFSGLVLQEIREYRSLAYTAGARFATPMKENDPMSFVGYVGTQSDKTLEALSVFYDLIRNMPKKEERMDMIRNYLIQSALTDEPGFRSLAQSIDRWKLEGYSQDPRIEKFKEYKTLNFNTVYSYYEKNLKDKPIVYSFVGDKKRVDMKEVEKYGKVIEVKEKNLFSK